MKVIELLNLLAENKVKKGTRIKYIETIYIIDFPNLCGIYPEGGTTKADNSLFTKLDVYSLNYEVEIIEDEEEIDIQEIEEVNHYDVISAVNEKTEENINNELKLNSLAINKIIKAIKQLDKKVNSIEQK